MRLINSSFLALVFLIPNVAISSDSGGINSAMNIAVNSQSVDRVVILDEKSNITTQVRQDVKTSAVAPKDTVVNNNSEMLVDFKDDRINQYWRAAFTQLQRGNWYKPSGSSAIEYYLNVNRLLKAKNPKNVEHIKISDESIANLLPYIHNAAENAIDNNNRAEAIRLLKILELIDKDSQTLKRIKDRLLVSSQPARQVAPNQQVQTQQN